MSVLVQSLTLVVRRAYLTVSYPGGSEGFLCDAQALENPPLFACDGDPRLLNLSFAEREHLDAATELLESHGLFAFDADDDPAFAIVDQREGPMLPCPWLEWERFTDAVTVAWIAGSEPGTLATPDGWEPSPATEEAVAPIAPPSPPAAYTPEVSALHLAVREAISDSGWRYYRDEPQSLTVDLHGEHAIYACRYYSSNALEVVACYTRGPLIVSESARQKTMEFITRANYGLTLGAFELGLDDGHLYYRAACPVRDGTLTTRMACTLANAGVWAFDRYLPAMLEMLHGDRDVVDAIRSAEG